MYSTLNSVVPDISIHLQDFIADENSPSELVEVATYMQDELHQRFLKYMDPKANNCDPTYIMAMLLSPREALGLS